MRKKIAVITGGSGFLGSHLCDKLIGKDFRVICLDNFITSSSVNIRHLLKDKNFRFVKHDVSEHINIPGKVDYILHFASPASPQDYLKFPIQTLKAGSLGTHNALGLARKKKAKFILASTSEIYGDPLEHPQRESYWGNVNSVGLRSCYDEAKRFSEAITMAYHRAYRLDTKTARIFNTYGPRMRLNDGRVIPNFIYQAINGKPVTVYGSGNQTRSFCYVSDLIEGIYKLALSNLNDPVNLGNDHEFTVMELASIILKLTKTSSKVITRPLPEDDPKQRKPDISRAKEMLNWQPRIELEEGIKATIEWFLSLTKK